MGQSRTISSGYWTTLGTSLSSFQNFEQAAQDIGSKLQADPNPITQDDASLMQSREQKLMPGGVRPPSDSISAETQRLATREGQPATPTPVVTPVSTQRSSRVETGSTTCRRR